MILRSILGSALLAALLLGAEANEQAGKMKPMFQSVDPSKATLVGSGEDKEYCAVCGMNLVKFYKTDKGILAIDSTKQTTFITASK